jgi:hypothetical protein
MAKEEEVGGTAAEAEVVIKGMKKVANKTLVHTEEAISRGVVVAMIKEEMEAIEVAIRTKIKAAIEVATIKVTITKATTITFTGTIRVRAAKELTLVHLSKPRKTIDLVYY